MTYRGVYRDGVVILQGEVDLENGTAVEVNPARSGKSRSRRRNSASAKAARPTRKAQSKQSRRTGKSAERPLPGFGAWKHRNDIADSAQFARELRRRVSARGSRG